MQRIRKPWFGAILLTSLVSGCFLGRAPDPNGLKGRLDCLGCWQHEPIAAGARAAITLTRPERRILSFAETVMPICTDDWPVAGALHGPASARTDRPHVATVDGVKLSETSLAIVVAARAPGTTRLRVDVGRDRDEFDIAVVEAHALKLYCMESEPPQSINNEVSLKGLMVGQKATCHLDPIGDLSGSFVDLAPDPHLAITTAEDGVRLRLEGAQPGVAHLRVRSGTRELDLPFFVVADGEPATVRLFANRNGGDDRFFKVVAAGQPIALAVDGRVYQLLRLEVETPDGRVAQPSRAELSVEDRAIAEVEPLARNPQGGRFLLKPIAPGATRLIWQLGAQRYEWPIVVAAKR
jgi:hypothetical protein